MIEPIYQYIKGTGWIVVPSNVEQHFGMYVTGKLLIVTKRRPFVGELFLDYGDANANYSAETVWTYVNSASYWRDRLTTTEDITNLLWREDDETDPYWGKRLLFVICLV